MGHILPVEFREADAPDVLSDHSEATRDLWQV